jgi:hypothetical protein
MKDAGAILRGARLAHNLVTAMWGAWRERIAKEFAARGPHGYIGA